MSAVAVGILALVLLQQTDTVLPLGDATRLVVEVPSGSVRLSFTVPRSLDVDVEGRDTRVELEGVDGDVSVETVNGDIRVVGGRGAVHASSLAAASSTMAPSSAAGATPSPATAAP